MIVSVHSWPCWISDHKFRLQFTFTASFIEENCSSECFVGQVLPSRTETLKVTHCSPCLKDNFMWRVQHVNVTLYSFHCFEWVEGEKSWFSRYVCHRSESLKASLNLQFICIHVLFAFCMILWHPEKKLVSKNILATFLYCIKLRLSVLPGGIFICKMLLKEFGSTVIMQNFTCECHRVKLLHD